MKFNQIVAFLIILIFFIFTVPQASGWSEDRGRGYLWEMNVAQDLKNSNYTGVARGVKVSALYIKYSGMSGNLYNFSFMGSFYSSVYLNGTLKIHGTSHTVTWKNTAVQQWINYEGYFLLEKCRYPMNGSESREFYGIKSIFMHIYTMEPEKRSEILQDRWEWFPHGMILEDFNYTLQYDASFTVNYSKPLPYIPISRGNISYYTNAHLEGSVKASGTGYHMVNNCTENLNKRVNRTFSGNTRFRVTMQFYNGTVKRSAILELLPIRIGTTDMTIINYRNETFTTSLIFGSMILNNATLGKDGFYSSITFSRYTFGMESYKSRKVGKEVVERIMNHAPHMYGEFTNQGNNILSTTVSIALVILMVFVSVETNLRGNAHNGKNIRKF